MLGLGTTITAASSYKSFDPTDIRGLSLWLKNNTGVAVGQWDDSSGNDNHATQSNADNQAAVSGGGLNFEGSDDNFYDLASKITVSTDHNFIVAVVVTIESYDSLNCILSDGANEFFEFQTNKKIRIKTLDGSATTTVLTMGSTTFNAAEKMLITISRNDSGTGTFNIYKNSEILSGTYSNQANPSGIEFANLGIRNDSDRPFDGIIHELLVYDLATTTHTDGELEDLNNYLRMVHGLAAGA